MYICRYFIYFIIFSFLGWIYESIYCTIKSGKWDNRGFLYGPLVPIYGVGSVLLLCVENLINTYIGSYSWWHIFLIGYAGSIILEYSTSWILEKLFHAYWWDYSNIPFNLHGRVCLPCSIGFGFAAIIVIYWIGPFVTNMVDMLPATAIEIFALLLMALISIDTTLTVSALTNFEKIVVSVENSLNMHMESFVLSVQENAQSVSKLIAEEKERFSIERFEHTISSMNKFSFSAIKRTQGFSITKVERGIIDNAVKTIKKYVPKKKNTK